MNLFDSSRPVEDDDPVVRHMSREVPIEDGQSMLNFALIMICAASPRSNRRWAAASGATSRTIVEIGAPHIPIDEPNPLKGFSCLAAARNALICETRGVVAIGNDHSTVREGWLDVTLHVIHAVSCEEQSHRCPAWRTSARNDHSPCQDLTHESTHWTIARLTRRMRRPSGTPQSSREPRNLCRRAAAVYSLEHYEFAEAIAHGGVIAPRGAIADSNLEKPSP